jgi:uncharacterized membrane protein YeaQ/YmgE (transglycosylase-associated protein family)
MMEIAMWVLAGGALGWVGCTYLGFNEERGTMLSVIIGMAGGFAGGQVVAPLFLDVSATPGAFNTPPVLFAVAVAAAFLFASDQLLKRWGI